MFHKSNLYIYCTCIKGPQKPVNYEGSEFAVRPW